jgi:membrane-associated phospholipid phosphatase
VRSISGIASRTSAPAVSTGSINTHSLMTTTHDRRDPGAAHGGSPSTDGEPDRTTETHPSPVLRRIGRSLSLRWSDPGSRRVMVGWALLVASLVVYFFLAGIPWSLNWVFVYVAAGLVVSSLGSGVKWKQLVKDGLPFFLVLTVYGLLRSYASHTLWGPFVRPQVWIDTHLFGTGVDPTVQLQRWLYTPGLHIWDYLCWCCYMSHFFVSFIVAAVLWKTNYAKFRRFVPLFIALTFLGYVTYVLYPAMPPWMASGRHYLPHTVRIVPLVLDHLHLHSGAAVLTGGDKFDNNVAAMPSIHAAYPMLICLFFWKGAGTRTRVLLAAYPLCMAFTLVYTGEHFVTDIVVGWLYAATTFALGSKVLDRWEARRERRGAEKRESVAV